MKVGSSSPFTKKLLTPVLPIAFQQFMSALVSASDALMLGALAQDAFCAGGDSRSGLSCDAVTT